MEKKEEYIKLSIIIPIYKVEKYLARCLESVAAQECDANRIEAILVDDGSPDNSGAICDQFAKTHSYVKVIHKENGGLSDARNAGITAANGVYCMFLDADDSLVPGSCSRLLQVLAENSPDILYGQINWIRDDHVRLYEKKGYCASRIYKGATALTLELKTGKYAAMAQMGVYSLNFLKRNDLCFKKGILHEDEQWSPRVLLKGEAVMRAQIPFYNYYIRENSITQNGNIKRYYDLIDTVKELDSMYKKSGNTDLQKYGCQYLAKLYMNAAGHIIACGEKYNPDRKIIRKNLHGVNNIIKGFIFMISPGLYVKMLGD